MSAVPAAAYWRCVGIQAFKAAPISRPYTICCRPICPSRTHLSRTRHFGWWHNFPKFAVSLLKAYFGDAARPDSDFGFAWLPRIVGDHSQLPMTLATRDGVIRGIFDPRGKGVYLQSAPGPAGGDAMTIHPRALDYPQSFLSGVIPD